MRLVWVIIPLVLFSIVGIQESFAETGILQFSDYHYGYIVSYNATSGITINNVSDYHIGNSFVMSVSSIRDGEIIFNISLDLLKSSYKCGSIGNDPDAFVLVNGEEVYFTYVDNPDENLVSIKIQIPSGNSDIEIIVGLDTGMWAIDYGCPRELSEFIFLLSPNHQIKNNVDSKDVICKEGLELIFKPTNDSPACVKPSTAEKLIERGWAISTTNHDNNNKLKESTCDFSEPQDSQKFTPDEFYQKIISMTDSGETRKYQVILWSDSKYDAEFKSMLQDCHDISIINDWGEFGLNVLVPIKELLSLANYDVITSIEDIEFSVGPAN